MRTGRLAYSLPETLTVLVLSFYLSCFNGSRAIGRKNINRNTKRVMLTLSLSMMNISSLLVDCSVISVSDKCLLLGACIFVWVGPLPRWSCVSHLS